MVVDVVFPSSHWSPFMPPLKTEATQTGTSLAHKWPPKSSQKSPIGKTACTKTSLERGGSHESTNSQHTNSSTNNARSERHRTSLVPTNGQERSKMETPMKLQSCSCLVLPFFSVCRRLHVFAPGNGAHTLKLNRVQPVSIACRVTLLLGG